LDEYQRVIFISTNRNFGGIGLGNLIERKFRNMQKFLLNIDVIREEMILLDELHKAFRTCFENYQELLTEEHFLDFSGMMNEVVQLCMYDKDFREKLNECFKHIIVEKLREIVR